MITFVFGHQFQSGDHVNDFTGFLVGAKLLGTSRLYHVSANLSAQKEVVQLTDPRFIFVRLPFWALAMKPFLGLPYRSALLLWRLILATALVVFSAVSPNRRQAALALWLSIPAGGAILAGNDSPLILAFVGISLTCWAKGWKLAAGAVLGLCLAKFHFLIFLPLLLLRRQYRRELMGFSAAVLLLIGVNFLVQPDWIPLYWRCLHLPTENMNPNAALMPDFYSSFFWTGHAGVATVAGVLLVGTLLWPICRGLEFGAAMPLCIFGGLLAAPHTNYLDGVLFLPAIFAATHCLTKGKVLGGFLLSPVSALLCLVGPASLGPAIVVGLSLWLLWRAARASRLPATGPVPVMSATAVVVSGSAAS